MKLFPILKLLAVAGLCCSLSGCWIISTTRHLPVPKGPGAVQTVTPAELVGKLNQRWKAIKTLTATVEIQATNFKTNTPGDVQDYTTIPANILLHTSGKLRVLGWVPILRTKLFDMSSDGENVTVYVPSQNMVYKGSAILHKKSENRLLDMRPAFFIDAMAVRGLDPDDYYTVTAETDTLEDTAKKHLVIVPEYVLSIMRYRANSHQLIPVRVITFHRDDLQPYEQAIYDADGNLETDVLYQGYADYGSGLYPSTVTIKRPLDQKQIVLTIDKVTVNMQLNDDQFVAKVPNDAKVQSLE